MKPFSLLSLLTAASMASHAHAAIPSACTTGGYEARLNTFEVSATLVPEQREMPVGGTISIELESSKPARVVLYNVSADGVVETLLSGSKGGILLEPGVPLRIPGAGATLRVAEPLGRNQLVVNFERMKDSDTPVSVRSDEAPEVPPPSADSLTLTHLTDGQVLQGVICFDVVAGQS